MYFYRSYDTNPYINLATEEYFLKNFIHNVCFIYRNNSSVIVGKHQNTNSQINHPFVYKNNIDIARRISGGGAVYHDLGNLNIAIIENTNKHQTIDFQLHTNKIIFVLKKFNISAQLKQKSNLFADTLKISGNAAHIWKNRIMHHGTLLFHSDISALEKSLRSNDIHYKDKSVKSQRSKAVNLAQFGLNNIEIFINEFSKSLVSRENYNLSQKDLSAINNLASNKYSTIDWNFGYSPNYIFQKKIRKKSINNIYLEVKHGLIHSIEIEGSATVNKKIEFELLNKFHHWKVFMEINNRNKFHEKLAIEEEDFIQYFF